MKSFNEMFPLARMFPLAVMHTPSYILNVWSLILNITKYGVSHIDVSSYRLRNKFCKIPTEENEKLYKKQRNKCVAIHKKSIRNYFNKIANGNIVTSRNF